MNLFLSIGRSTSVKHFSDIMHDDSWTWYLVTDEARFLKKKLATRIRAQWPEIKRKIRFSAVFLSLDHTFS